MTLHVAVLAALAPLVLGAPTSTVDPQAGGLSQSQPIPQLLEDTPDLFYLPQPTAAPGIGPILLPPANQSQAHATAGNWVGTALFGYEECKKRNLNKAKIDDAFYDMFYLTNIDGVSKDIDWHSAAAVEYLGPPANNQQYQARIQKLLYQASQTSYDWHTPNAHYIHVRCDDPANKCSNTCGPDGTDGGSSKTIAYASQRDENGYSQINFCPRFFDMRRLRTAAVDFGKARLFPQNYWADKYDNTARVFLHELMHLDHFMGVSAADHVWDLTIQTKNGGIENVYGPTNSKIMARYQRLPPFPTEPTSDWYVSRNADSMAWYATVRYVQNELGAYPHLPIIARLEDGPPWKDPGLMFYSVYSDGTNPAFNISSTVTNAETSASQCRDDTSDPAGASAPGNLDISGMAPESAYPDAYNMNRTSWTKQDLNGTSSATPLPKSPSPSPIGTPSPTSTLAPQASDTCGDWYKFFFDHFEIYGKNFNSSKFGIDGSGLEQQIKGCSDLTSWHFEPRTNDPQGYQWYASGNLPIGTKACVGRAVVSAGGASADGCTGAG